MELLTTESKNIEEIDTLLKFKDKKLYYLLIVLVQGSGKISAAFAVIVLRCLEYFFDNSAFLRVVIQI